jgi:hypothetical protein
MKIKTQIKRIKRNFAKTKFPKTDAKDKVIFILMIFLVFEMVIVIRSNIKMNLIRQYVLRQCLQQEYKHQPSFLEVLFGVKL